jgi:predicted FMN-binding regulatory protein PaiB
MFAMYIPPANEEKRVSVMQALMVSHPLGTLVTFCRPPTLYLS